VAPIAVVLHLLKGWHPLVSLFFLLTLNHPLIYAGMVPSDYGAVESGGSSVQCPATQDHAAEEQKQDATRRLIRRMILTRHLLAALAARMWDFAVVLLLSTVRLNST